MLDAEEAADRLLRDLRSNREGHDSAECYRANSLR